MSSKTSNITYAQQGVYIDCVMDPENLRYNNPQIVSFPAGVTPQAVFNATKKTLECHPALFSHFEDREGEIKQVYSDRCCADVKITETDDAQLAAIKAAFVKVFDIEHGPLYRAEVVATPSGVSLLIDFHHLVYDGASLNIILNEIFAAVEGTDPAPEQHTYAAFADAQEADTTDHGSTKLTNHKSYFDNMLNGVTPTKLSGDKSESQSLSSVEGHAEHVQFVSTPDVMTKAKALGTAPSALFMAAAFYTLSRYTNTKELCMTTISNGRSNPLTQGCVGMFVNTLPLVCKVEDVSVSTFIHGIRDMFLATRQHEEYPFSAIANDYGIEQHVRFTYQYGTLGNRLYVNGEVVKAENLRINSHTFPFTITISQTDDKPAITINYDTAKYSADFISRFAESMDAVVARFIANPEGRLIETSIMSERQETEVSALRHTCIDGDALRFTLFHKSLEYWAEQTPDATAVIACNETLTYRQFNEKANILAHALINKGVVRGDRICLLLPRKSWHLIAMFGVMKTGAAYIPCDPEYPAERINLITDDSHARYVITTKDKMTDYGDRALDVEELLNDGSTQLTNHGATSSLANPDVEVSPDDLAYLIYTSGSTGRPKGVMLRHIGICNYLTPHKENRHIHAFVAECKSMMGITTVSFDLSLKELGATIYNGKTLVLANEEEIMSPILMAELYKRTGCDGFNGTPSRLKMFLELPEFQQVIKNVKVIILGGEKYPATLIPQLRSITSARLFNTYGPTEITVSSNVGELTNEDKVTVGEPLLNYHEYIVDADNNELPVGVVGELLIGGIGVGGGYNDLPEKTAEAFVDYQGQRVYRSGDYARWLANGKVEILGRKDHQIKLNGLRIELGEVETVLNRQPQVKEGVVMIKSVEGHDHLVAYYVPATPDADQIDTLKEEMGKSLTHYMVPTIFVQMEKMPISPNGKTDLKALPEPVLELSAEEKVMPTTADEQSLYDIVAEIVGNDNFGITTNLVGVGLTSLLAIRLSVLVKSKLNVTLSVRDILRFSTVKELAAKIQGDACQSKNSPISSLARRLPEQRPSTAATAPLSFSQIGIYSECIVNPEDIQYNIPVIMDIPQGVTPQQLKSALEQVVKAHPYMNVHFQDDDNGDVYQCPIDDAKIEIPIRKLTEQELEQAKEDFVRPFALKEGPLYRLEIVETPSAVYLLSDCHHLIMDGGSNDIFLRQLCRVLDGESIEAETYDYYQFVADQKIDATTEQFFAEQLGQIEESSALIPDRYDGCGSHREMDVLCPTDLQAVQDKCKQLNITPAVLYLAATTIAVSKYTAEDTVGICTVSSGRSNLNIANTFGMFVNTLPLVSKIDYAMSVDDYLRQVADTFLETLANEDYPYGRIVEKYGFAANIMYAYQVGLISNYCCGKGEVKRHYLELQKAKFPVSVLIEGSIEQGGVIHVQYDESLFTETMMTHFAKAIQQVVTDLLASKKLSDVRMCNEQMTAILDTFNVKTDPVSADEDANETVLSLFKRTVEQYPDNIAAVFKEKRYTYRELDELTDKIGGLIYSKVKDCGKEEPVVSILIPRNEYIFILPLAAMKAGCAYQPLDPSYPQERLNFMVKDADAALLIADDSLCDIITEYEGETLFINENENENLSPLTSHLSPQSLFILLYTSGSTGVPKGVMLEHQNLVAFIKFYRRYYDLKPEHNVAAYASFGFDANMMDLYPALTTGSTVHIIPEEIRLDLVAINDYFEANDITHGFFTTQVGVQFLQNTENHSLKHLSVGGEKLVSVEPATGYTFHNLYGPTECTVFVTATPVLKKESNIPIGKSNDLVDCYVVDKQLHRLPIGAAGELVIAGKQVGRGYLNRPDKTAEVFFTINGERAYHTGDIVRYREDGNIEFVGRKDGQVKIRGFRIELKEVEAVIRDFAGIDDVTVQAFDDPNGGKYIAAYIVSEKEVDIDALNAFILDQKPPYMVPAVTMQIEKIPLNVNQKVDKKALPKPELKANVGGNAPAAPLNALEKELKAVIASVVNTEDFNITDVLGYVGLTSITSIKLATLIYKKYGIQIPANTLAKTGTLQSIENEILEMWMSGGNKNENKNENGNENENEKSSLSSAPLTYPQTGVYLDCMKNPGSTLYNIPEKLIFSRNITVEELQDAVMATVANHQSFNLSFGNVDGNICQIMNEKVPVYVPISALSESDLAAFQHDFVRPFNLAQAPLFRFEIVKTESNIHLFMDLHHLIADGGSVNILVNEISARLNGEEVEPENYTYMQFANDQRAAEGDEEYMAAKAFFDARLAGCEGASEITADMPKDDSAVHTIKRITCPVDMIPVERLAKSIGVTPMNVYLAAAYYTVSRFVNSKQVYLGTISNGRSNLRTYNTTGMFVNTLALSSDINDQKVSEYIAETADNFLETIAHEQYPFAQIAADYGFKPEIMFEYQVGVLNDQEVRGEKAILKGLTLDLAKFKLKIAIYSSADGGHEIVIGYDETVYSPELAASFTEAYKCAIDNFAAQPDALVKNISIMSDAQRAKVETMRTIALTDVPFKRFYEPIEYWAEKTPETLAVYACDRQLTFREFNAECNRVAHALMAKGVKRGDRVVLLLPRTSQVLCCIFGVSKTGAAYIPCDPAYPAERINLITEDSEATYVITTSEHMAEHEGKAILVDELFAYNEGDCLKNPCVDVSPDDLVYLIYTSGSTGRPKGVMLRHAGICSYLYDHPANKHIHGLVTEGVKAYVCITTLSFDMSLKEYGVALHNGITAVLANEDEVNNPMLLAELFRKTGAQAINGTPSRILNCMESEEFCEALSKCKVIMCGGEKYSDKLLERLHDMKLRIFNTYGPTEITVSSNCAELTNTDQITIGEPLLNYTEFVVDSDGNELPVGVVGELYIGGPGVARGYNNLPEQTAERFIEYQGIRVYRSGDYARWLPDGRVDVLGRLDNQVKLNGLRIELGEVESVISKVEGVKQTVVLIRNIDGRDHLSAYYVADRVIDIEDMKQQIGQTLTHYMVPTAYMQMEKFPLTPNGKTDVKNLPMPLLAKLGGDYVAPRNKMEEDFCHIFETILNMEKVSAADSFFELGGTSLTATRVIIEAKNAGYEVAYADVFSHPTAQQLARLVGGDDNDDYADPEVTDYDYTKINALLAKNNLDSFRNGERLALGDVLLTGANGYLGIHILHNLIENHLKQNPQYKIYCLVRHGKNGVSSESRLRNLLFYYFEKSYKELFGKQVMVIDGDVTNPAAFDQVTVPAGSDTPLTVINCAAIVKHFSEGTEIEDINIGGLQNCVDYCLKTGSRLIQTSTNSTGGLSVNGYPDPKTDFSEQVHYFGQSLTSKYTHSKFLAERIVLEAIIEKGLVAKVVRLGNLAPRVTDGEFQINFRSNSAMGRLHIFQMLGVCSYGVAMNRMEFSPIDEVAEAVLLLATTPRECCVFHPFNNHMVMLGDIIREMAKTLGISIEEVEEETFKEKLNEAAADAEKAKILQSMLAYNATSKVKLAGFLKYNPYTIQVLARLGFHWDVTSWDYVQRFIKAIAALDFFEDKR